MTEFRPDPDALLASLNREEQRARRGQLKVFFGMCPGVGKTYAMLNAAQQELLDGVNLAVGVVETHGRPETEALLTGLPIIPRKRISYKNIQLTEMDLEAILERKPKLVLVDEFAHTNAPGSRHPKRYQDVVELLDAGISVYTTLNVQHIESRADAVRQITGATVQPSPPRIFSRTPISRPFASWPCGSWPSMSTSAFASFAPSGRSRPSGAPASACSWRSVRAPRRRSLCAGPAAWLRRRAPPGSP